MLRKERITIFVQEIEQWYGRHKRELPWRDLSIKDDTKRAYQILVSEIMLQQTQVSRVIIKYKEFLQQFPTIEDLATASNKDVILAWRGMGYNNRAIRLRDAAYAVVNNYSSFPMKMDQLQSLPGVGHYTAAAIRNFAFNIPTPCLDTNIRRIVHRTFVGPENPDSTWKKDDKYLLCLATQVLEEALQGSLSTSNWHAALMDFGSLVCTKRNPKWDVCPLTKKGIMKAAYRITKTESRVAKEEPGRLIGSKFIPNRIFRGKVIDELRDEPAGLSSSEIGTRICIDWNASEHSDWLQGIIEALQKDNLIAKTRGKLTLAD